MKRQVALLKFLRNLTISNSQLAYFYITRSILYFKIALSTHVCMVVLSLSLTAGNV